MRSTALLTLLAMAPTAPRAQDPAPLPAAHRARMLPGTFVDLDTGLILPALHHAGAAADLVFERDGEGLFFEVFAGAQRCRPEDAAPRVEAWSGERQRLGTGPHHGALTWFARTDRGALARLSLGATESFGVASAFLSWVVAPPPQAVLVMGPAELRPAWSGEGVLLTWRDDFARYLVEVEGPAGPSLRPTNEPRLRLPDRDGDLHRIRVFGVAGDGAVSAPAEIACHGRHRPTARGAVTLPEGWHTGNGGVSLRTGAPDAAQPDLVLYLYGAHVPGGGVVWLGKGRECFRDAAVLPERGYRPSRDGLERGDVLALRLADGLYAKVMIEPAAGGDASRGLDVRFAFLAAGGRHFLPRPQAGSFQAAGGGLELAWSAVEGAAGYGVTREDDPAPPLETAAPRALVPDLAPDRFHAFEVVAVDGHGDESDPLRIEAHTFSDRYRVGRFELHATPLQGYSLTEAKAVARGDGPAPPRELEVMITASAGGASYLELFAPYGGALARGLRFGELPDDAELPELQQSFASDVRDPEAQVLLVRTADGKLASARLTTREHPRIVIDYVLRK